MGLSLPPALPHGVRHVSHGDRVMSGYRHLAPRSHHMKVLGLLAAAIIATCIGSSDAHAQSPYPPATWDPPVMDNSILGHVLFDQLEGRTNGPDNNFRWDGQGWI